MSLTKIERMNGWTLLHRIYDLQSELRRIVKEREDAEIQWVNIQRIKTCDKELKRISDQFRNMMILEK